MPGDIMKKMLRVAKEESLRDFIILHFLCGPALRRSEIVGTDNHVPKKGYPMKGLHVGDFNLDRGLV